MINKGDRVTIKMSRNLLLMGLGFLTHKTGVVVRTLLKNKNPGVLVKLDERVRDYSLWFIPIQSAVTKPDKTQATKMKLLKDTLV